MRPAEKRYLTGRDVLGRENDTWQAEGMPGGENDTWQTEGMPGRGNCA